MIDLEKQVIIQGKQVDPILEWDVWWRNPKGLFIHLEECMEECKKNDWPITVIRPVPVAVGDLLYEEG